jgi:hypothetical protein
VTPPSGGPAGQPVGGRRGVARAWLVIGSMAAAVLLVLGPIGVVSLVSHEEHAVSRTYSAAVVRLVELHVDQGRVLVVGDGTDVVRIEGRVSRGLRPNPLRIGVREGVLVVGSECSGPFSLHCGVDLTIHVPPGVGVVGTSVDADLAVQRLTATVDLTVRDGDVDLDAVTGAVRAAVRDGTVRGGGLGAGPITVSTRDGDVDIAFASPPGALTAGTRDGAVTVVVPSGSGPYAVRATTGDGSVDTPVRTDPTSQRVVDLEAADGDVVLTYPSS